MKKQKILRISCYVTCALLLSGILLNKNLNDLKCAKDIALNNLEALSNPEDESDSGTTIKKCVLSGDFTKSDSGTYYLICASGTNSSTAYKCPTFAQEGRVEAFYTYCYCTKE